jgi:hypothetical protein
VSRAVASSGAAEALPYTVTMILSPAAAWVIASKSAMSPRLIWVCP